MTVSDFPWGHSKRYNDYSSHIRKLFADRIQKVSVDAGFSCPNRDGSKGRGGCIYCNNSSFSPVYCGAHKSISQQVEEGIQMFFKKYRSQYYFAYFQSYTNTYGQLQQLKATYEEALENPRVKGLVIGTRPDCVDEPLLDYLADLHKTYFVQMEYGLESTLDASLEIINRCHTHADSVWAIEQTAKRKIPVGVHMILGLPGESREQILAHAGRLSALSIGSIKLHQLQVVRNTQLAKMYQANANFVNLFEINDYIELVIDFLELLSPSIVVERFASQSPAELLIAPKWGLKNFELVAKIEKRLKERNTYQGRKYTNNNV